jgi:hypothetical protein
MQRPRRRATSCASRPPAASCGAISIAPAVGWRTRVRRPRAAGASGSVTARVAATPRATIPGTRRRTRGGGRAAIASASSAPARAAASSAATTGPSTIASTAIAASAAAARGVGLTRARPRQRGTRTDSSAVRMASAAS